LSPEEASAHTQHIWSQKPTQTVLCLHRPKNNFAEAKARAKEVLDACPTKIIQKFINRSWRFIDAYRKGVTGEAAACKQKSHRAVSESAMKALEACSMDKSAA
jgi:hypothetical protein